MFSCSEESDYVFPDEMRHESEVILKEIGVPYQINLYSGTTHGFAVRANLDDELQKYAKEQAFYQAVVWFTHHLMDRKV
jgi:dienelactone hydrolase